jgi:hypothetical protein
MEICEPFVVRRADGDGAAWTRIDIFQDRRLAELVIAPLHYAEGPTSAAALGTVRPAGLSATSLAALERIMPALRNACELRTLRQVELTLLNTYVGATTGRRILSGRIRRGQIESLDAALMLCDLRGFTDLSNRLPTDRVLILLNRYFDQVLPAITGDGGEVLKFMGDAVLAFFHRDDAAAEIISFQRANQLLRRIVQERSTAEQLMLARGTTAYPWLECVAKDAGARTLLLECPNAAVEKRGLLKWLNELVRADRSNDSALLSPALQSNLQQVTEPRLLGDQGLLQLADEVFVLRLLKRGRLRRVLDQHLLSHSQQTAIHIAVGERLVPSDLAPSLVERGCRIWPHVASPGPPRQLRLRTPVVNHSSDSPASTVMLTHWTRAASGPWPDQTVDQFRREIVFDRAAAERGPLATLLRILAMRRLCASRQAIRGSYPVVCFTAVPFDELTRHLVYRRHRGRWDFCPYGISISREWLLARGARPVIYGEAATWEQLDDDDRPYFQSNDLRPSSQPTNACQWSTEREWRIVGDVDLSDLPADKAWIFVPTPIEARWASFLSRWPVRLADPTAPAPSLPRESM